MSLTGRMRKVWGERETNHLGKALADMAKGKGGLLLVGQHLKEILQFMMMGEEEEENNCIFVLENQLGIFK